MFKENGPFLIHVEKTGDDVGDFEDLDDDDDGYVNFWNAQREQTLPNPCRVSESEGDDVDAQDVACVNVLNVRYEDDIVLQSLNIWEDPSYP